jgi:N-acetylglutamate synthase-like GNAT family acetyltransferase
MFWEKTMIEIKNPATKDDFKGYYNLRYRVLRQPWGMPKGTEKDDYEPISQHFMAVDNTAGEIVGCVKMFEKESGVGQFSHMAVHERRQRQGIGNLLLEAVEKAARQNGYSKLGTITHLNSTGFFEKYGYEIKGLPTNPFGMTQMVWMEKDL